MRKLFARRKVARRSKTTTPQSDIQSTKMSRKTRNGSMIGPWTWEIASVAGSAALLSVLVAVLALYDGQPVFTWHGVTLNAIVSVLSTASKAMLLFATEELVSQWKWILFTNRARPLIDFERIDAASRGLLGSLQLMWRCKEATILRIGALVILLGVALEPFTQQLVQYRQGLVYSQDGQTIVSRASRYSKGSGMQAAVYYGMVQQLETIVQQAPFKCSTGNCTWPTHDSLAICSRCTNLDDQLGRSTTDGGLWSHLDCTDGVAASISNGGTSFRLPNGLFIENPNGWFVNGSSGEGDNLGALGAVMMTTFGTGIASETASMQGLDTLIWSMSMIRAKTNPGNFSAVWPDVPPSAMECALHYCINSYDMSVTEGVLQQSTTQVQDAARVPQSWQPTGNVETTDLEALNTLTPELASLLDISRSFSAVQRTDLALSSPAESNTQYNISQSAVDSTSSFFHGLFASKLDILNITHDGLSLGRLSGYYISNGKVQYEPSSMQVLFSSADLVELFTSLATSMSNAIRDGADAADSNGATDNQVIGSKGTMTTFYDIQWPWISLHCAVFVLGVAFFALTLSWTRSAPVWKSSSLAVMARGHQVQHVVQQSEALKQFEANAKGARVMLVQTSPLKEDQTECAPLESAHN